MTDREKVIKALECCGSDNWVCYCCPYEKIFEEDNMPGCTSLMAREAIELLKEQDAVEPIRSKDADVWYCGNCDAIVGEETLTMGGIQEVRHNYCPECGRKVNWDENINLPR